MTGRVTKTLVWIAIASALAFGVLAVLMQAGYYNLSVLIGVPFSVGLASLGALACSFARHRGKLRVAMFAGVAMSIIGASLASIGNVAAFVSMSGTVVPLIDEVAEDLVSSGGVILSAAIVMAQWGLLAILRLEWRWSRSFRGAAQYTALLSMTLAAIDILVTDSDTYSLIATIIVMLQLGATLAYFHVRRFGRRINRFAQYGGVIFLSALALVIWQWELIDWLGQLAFESVSPYFWIGDLAGGIALIAVILTMVTAGLALLEHLQRRERLGSLRPASLVIDLVCPRCHLKQEIHAGNDSCRSCGLRFTLQIEEPYCECGYLLYQLHDGKCPECGRVIVASQAEPLAQHSAARPATFS